MCFVNDDCFQELGIKFPRPLRTRQGLIGGYSAWSRQTKTRGKQRDIQIRQTCGTVLVSLLYLDGPIRK